MSSTIVNNFKELAQQVIQTKGTITQMVRGLVDAPIIALPSGEITPTSSIVTQCLSQNPAIVVVRGKNSFAQVVVMTFNEYKKIQDVIGCIPQLLGELGKLFQAQATDIVEINTILKSFSTGGAIIGTAMMVFGTFQGAKNYYQQSTEPQNNKKNRVIAWTALGAVGAVIFGLSLCKIEHAKALVLDILGY